LYLLTFWPTGSTFSSFRNLVCLFLVSSWLVLLSALFEIWFVSS
jgi:hypothetical protein